MDINQIIKELEEKGYKNIVSTYHNKKSSEDGVKWIKLDLLNPFEVEEFFKKEVVEPIKYHVLAKRYLAKEKKYFNSLSNASKISLKLQGGVLNKNESKEFEKKIFLNNQ